MSIRIRSSLIFPFEKSNLKALCRKIHRDKYAEMIKATFRSKQKYLSFLNRLQKAEQEVIQAAIRTMEMGTQQERVRWFGKVPEAFKKAKVEPVAKIFFSQNFFC